MSAPSSLIAEALSASEANSRLEQHGPNALPEAKPVTLWQRFVTQFRNPLIYILLGALALDAGLWMYEGWHGIPLESLTILVILLANAGLGVWQENKSEQALAKIKAMAAPQSWVVRDGRLVQVDATQLVPGDLVRVEAGDRIPADGVLRHNESMSVDESILTGESMPLEKQTGDRMSSGTLAVRGFCYLQIDATGQDSAMGQLASLLTTLDMAPSPLERRLKQFGGQIALIVILLALGLFGAGVWLVGTDHTMVLLMFAVALAVAAVPESLPAVLTLTMSLGMERMSKRKAIVRRMAAVEALGSITVIATDKTGTLTENAMQVKQLVGEDVPAIMAAMTLANDADLETGAGDPLESGLLRYVGENASDILALQQQLERVSVTPFSSEWKYMRVTVTREAQAVSYLKGAPEVVMERCDLDDQTRQFWLDEIERCSEEGYRLIALAKGEGEREEGLNWLGLVLLWDPPRQEVPAAIKHAKSAGIRPLMMTGDHPGTARCIARKVGIDHESVMTGTEVDDLSDAELQQALTECSVFARITPEHKLRIVQSLQQSDEVVAVTGDGVNDAPALKAADVGVAMGQRGSDVSREVADLVLLDDNFATIVSAIREGRNIYENIQKFIRTLFSTNLSEVLLIALGALLVFATTKTGHGELLLPLTAVQILWINLLTDSLPALAIATDHNEDVMALPPRQRNEPLVDETSLSFILFVGVLGGLVALTALFGLFYAGLSNAEVQTWVFCFVVLVQLSFVLPARKVRLPSPKNHLVIGALILCGVAQICTLYSETLQALLGVTALDYPAQSGVALAVLACWLIAEKYSQRLQARNRRIAAAGRDFYKKK